ncbi:hypothetical protein M0802_010902 [Mischocyttarus mexicanus]|nr:hypothetical protein M0802_010902 [Mischocyttarus mexicanus]
MFGNIVDDGKIIVVVVFGGGYGGSDGKVHRSLGCCTADQCTTLMGGGLRYKPRATFEDRKFAIHWVLKPITEESV